jgi:hypothetical protein
LASACQNLYRLVRATLHSTVLLTFLRLLREKRDLQARGPAAHLVQFVPIQFVVAGASVAATLENTRTSPSATSNAAAVVTRGIIGEQPSTSKIQENKDECKDRVRVCE